MLRYVEERERPSEWLRGLREEPAAYAELLEECGDLYAAAHRLASARCRAAALPTTIPTLREVHAAAREILERGCDEGTPIPSMALLTEECAAARLPVIA